MPSVASTSVDIAGPPPETKNVALKSPRANTVSSRMQTKYRFAISGKVTCLNRLNPVAPSTSAASYSSCGTAMRPASRMIVQNGRFFQI